jgi:glycosyltransferase involved in cell wall biosynthesis
MRAEHAPLIYHCGIHGWFARPHFYQGLAREFARTRTVLYVSRELVWPMPASTGAGRRRIKGGYLSQLDERLWVLEPVVPRGTRFAPVRALQDRLVARGTLAAAERLGIDPANALLWCYSSASLPLVSRRPAMRAVYWTGDEVSDPDEPKLLDRVDDVFAVSPAALVLKRRHVGERAVPMPMAIDPEPLIEASRSRQTPPELRGLPRPLVGFGGALSKRIDWALLRAILRRRLGTLLLVGPAVDVEAEQGIAELVETGPAVWLGHRGPEQAPHYLAAFDVGLIPYERSPFNLGSNPVKFYEYLAAGIPIVSTSLPALSSFGEVASFEDEPERFADAAAAAAFGTKTAADLDRRQAVAQQHSYRALVGLVDAHLHSTDRRRPSAEMVFGRT